MEGLKTYTRQELQAFYTPRIGEQKLGDTIELISDINQLNASSAKFVLLGIPEEIGVKANLGVGGTSSLWNVFLGAFLSVQSNNWLSSKDVVLLGQLVPPNAGLGSVAEFRSQVATLDDIVFPILKKIALAGKIPIVIGGGHNNAYPILKGLSIAQNSPVNTINIDAHADIRDTSEGRHSGNGFSSAIEQGYLSKYGVFGLHQNYNNQNTLLQIAKNESINTVFFDDLLSSDANILESWNNFREQMPEKCGLEIDLDAISNMLSSAVSNTGFELNDIRKILLTAKHSYQYLHICEGAVKLEDGRENKMMPKSVAYLVTDFIKAQNKLL